MRVEPAWAEPVLTRAMVLLSARRDGVLDPARKAIELWHWREAGSLHAVLLGHVAARRDGDVKEARLLLDEAAARCDTSLWPYPIVKYFRGEISEEKLLAEASDKNKATAVHCYLGLEALQNGKTDSARAHFLWVKEHGNTAHYEYMISRAELERLEPAPKKGGAR
jgi:lipoprotein NlpI